MIEGIIIVSKYHNKLPQAQMKQLIMKNIMITTVGAAIISLIIYILLLRNKEENLWARCQFKKVSAKNGLLIFLTSIGTAMLSCSFIFLTQNIKLFQSYSQVAKTLQANTQSILGIVSSIILIPIFEEILFRGLIFNELRKHVNLVLSIVLQAAIFALFHGLTYGQLFSIKLNKWIKMLYCNYCK
jgi:membrane protease YdiL (CAAX protease family)